MIKKDLALVKTLLPEHYSIEESKHAGNIHCVSKTGFRKNIDTDDDLSFGSFVQSLRNHFGPRFQEVFHNVCFCHTDFTIFIKAA